MTSRGPYRKLHADKDGRQCSMCLEYKPWAQYYRQRGGLNDHQPRCKTCENLRKQGADLYEMARMTR